MNFLSLLQGSLVASLESLRLISFLNNTLDQVLLALLIVVVGWATARIFTFILGRYVVKLTRKTSTQIDDFAIEVFKNVGNFVIFVMAFLYATRVLTLAEQIDIFVERAILVIVVIKVTAAFLKIFDFVVSHYLVPYASKNGILDRTMVPTLNRLVKLGIWAIVALMIVSNLGYNISSLLAGLGIGGLAIALAAQDALSNFFGSISIFADKTFKMGDYVRTKEFDGNIKAVGLRSTRLETVDGTELIVPNSQLASMVVENLSRRPKRRVDVTLSVIYETSNTKMKEGIKIVKDIIAATKDVENHCRVNFQTFSAHGLDIMVSYWIKDTDLEKGKKIQNEINFKIKQGFEKAKIEFAYPTQLLYLKNLDGTPINPR